MSTFIFQCRNAYCSGANIAVSRAVPATQMAKMSPELWSKTSSVGTRESEEPKMATTGDYFEITATRSRAACPRGPHTASARGPWPESSACFRASSEKQPCQKVSVFAAVLRHRLNDPLCGLDAPCRDRDVLLGVKGKGCGEGPRRAATGPGSCTRQCRHPHRTLKDASSPIRP